MTQASVIVPARDAGATIGRTLAALERQELDGSFEVIVVDDGSRDDTVAVARAAGERVRVLRQDGLGPAAARNRGVAAATGTVLAFCDADCYPQPGWLRAGAAALERAELVQGRVLPDPGKPVGPFDRTLWVTAEVGLYETANLFVTRETFDGVGGFEDWLRPRHGKAMAEDVWFGWRVRRAGGRSAFCRQALAYHEVFGRSARGYVEERRRLEHFPEMVGKIPELRETLCWRRTFLNRRTAAFDAAVAGVAAAGLWRSPLPLVAAAPYVAVAARRARHHGRGRAPLIAAVDVAADAVGLCALAYGSARARTPLL